MAQIVTNKAISTRCNLTAIQTGGSKANTVLQNGEIWLVDTTNADKGTNGFGLYDSYIIGDGTKVASSLTVQKIDNGTDDAKDIDFRANAGECEENVITVNDSVKECLIAIDDDLGDVHDTLGQTTLELGLKADSATTLAGYGIIDAKINNGVITLGSATISPAVINDNTVGGTAYSSTKIDNTYAKKTEVKLDFEEGDTGTNIDLSTSYVTYAPQSMTSAQKAQARENIEAPSTSEVTSAINGCVKTTGDQSIYGSKVFGGEVVVDNAGSPYITRFTGETKIEGQFLYTKKNANAAAIDEGLLIRDSTGNVYSTTLKTINNQSLIGDGNITISGGGGTQVQSDWNQTDNTSVDYIKNKPTLPVFVDVSSMFGSAPVLPSGYTMAQLKENNLYAIVNGNRFPVTLKYSSSSHNGRFFYVDYDGSSVSCVDSPVSIGEYVYVSGTLQDTNGNPISDYTLIFNPTKTSYEGVTFSSESVYIYPDASGAFTARLQTGMTYYLTGGSSSTIIHTIDQPYYSTSSVTGLIITI